MEETLLSAKFQMLPSCSVYYDVTLTRRNLMFVEQANGKQQRKFTSILMDTIIGCKMYNSKLSQDICSYFKIITLSKGKKSTRQKRLYAFRVDEKDNLEGNNIIAEEWTCMLLWMIANPQISVEELLAMEYFPPQKKFFVVLNPKSGSGKSLQSFRSVIEPLFLDANIKYEVSVTEYTGHLTEKALTFDYTCWDAVVICSGDGLVYEYLNGVMKRPDWHALMQLPIGILPTGSGNALAATVLHSAKEKFCLVNAIYVLLKGRSHPMDIFSITTRDKRTFGFLTVTWGLVADIDIESEKYRAIGQLRFQVGALQRILKLRHYTGVFSYLPGKSLRGVECGSEVSEADCTSTTMSGTEDIDVSVANENDSSNPTDLSVIGSCQQENISEVLFPATTQENQETYGPKCTIPSLDELLPEDWVTIDGEFISIVISALSHIGSDTHWATGMCIDDGLLNLQIIKQGPKTRKMLQLLSSSDSGKHVDFPEVETDNITAFRLTPDPSGSGHLCVDGELVDYEPIQGEIYPSLAHMIVMPSIS